jgi:hypothetical protein
MKDEHKVALATIAFFIGIYFWFGGDKPEVGEDKKVVEEVKKSPKEVVQELSPLQEHQERLESMEEKAERQMVRKVARDEQKAQTIQLQKDQAWESWYKEPEGCDHWETDRDMVECADYKIKAKDEFEQLWVEGKFVEGKIVEDAAQQDSTPQ